MNGFRVVLTAFAVSLLAALPADAAGYGEAPQTTQQQTTPPASRDRTATSGREARPKERIVPPPRPITPAEGAEATPALREECSWLGQRIVSLLYRDDPMTGNDFVPFYLKFDCPESHLRRAFRCLVKTSDHAENDVLADRVAQCWADPDRAPQTASAKDSNAHPSQAEPTKPGEAKPQVAPQTPPSPQEPPNQGGKTGEPAGK